MRRFVENHGAFLPRQRGEAARTLGALAGEETLKGKSSGGQAGERERGQRGGGAGHHGDGQVGFRDGCGGNVAGVGDGGHARIREQQHALAVLYRLHDGFATFGFVVVVVDDDATAGAHAKPGGEGA